MANEEQTEGKEPPAANAEVPPTEEPEAQPQQQIPLETEKAQTKPVTKKYITKHMKMYPELYRSDVSIHPSYTTLKNFPYYVVCRRRVQSDKRRIRRQLNREIMNFAMTQLFAIDSVRIDRVFSFGMSPRTLTEVESPTPNEIRHINELLYRPSF